MDTETLLELYPNYTSVLGPYTRSDGRKHIVLNNSNAAKGTKGKTKTISYPKALIEINLKTRLKSNETVNHDDRDFTNDEIYNLKVKDRSAHASADAIRVKINKASCEGCGIMFTPSKAQINERSKNNAGPFCSRPYIGRYSVLAKKDSKLIEQLL